MHDPLLAFEYGAIPLGSAIAGGLIAAFAKPSATVSFWVQASHQEALIKGRS